MGQDIRAGGAFVEVYLKGISAAGRQLGSIGKSLGAFGAGVTAVGAAITTPFVAAAKSFAATGDAIDKLSLRTGIASEYLTGIGFAAEQCGASLDLFEKGIRRMQSNLFDAERGSALLTDSLTDIGLSFDQLKSLAPEDQFETIAAGIAKLESTSKQAAIAQKIFGRAGAQLLPLMKSNIRALREEATALGITFTQEDTTAAAGLTDAMNRLFRVNKAVYEQMGAAVAGVLTKWVNAAALVGATAAKWVRSNRDLMLSIFLVGVGVAATGTVITALGGFLVTLGAVISSATAIAGAFAAAMAFIVSPIGAAAVAIASATTYFLAFTDTGKKLVSQVVGYFRSLSGDVVDSLNVITEAIAAGDLESAFETFTTQAELLFDDLVGGLLDKWSGFAVEFRNVVDYMQSYLAAWLGRGAKSWETLFGALPEIAAVSGALALKFVSGMLGDIIAAIRGTIEGVAATARSYGVDLGGGTDFLKSAEEKVRRFGRLDPQKLLDDGGAAFKKLARGQAEAEAIYDDILAGANDRADAREQKRFADRETYEKRIAELKERLGTAKAGAGRTSIGSLFSGIDAGLDAAGNTKAFVTNNGQAIQGFFAVRSVDLPKKQLDALLEIDKSMKKTERLLGQNLAFA